VRNFAEKSSEQDCFSCAKFGKDLYHHVREELPSEVRFFADDDHQVATQVVNHMNLGFRPPNLAGVAIEIREWSANREVKELIWWDFGDSRTRVRFDEMARRSSRGSPGVTPTGECEHGSRLAKIMVTRTPDDPHNALHPRSATSKAVEGAKSETIEDHRHR
jgi:hypothetical protein